MSMLAKVFMDVVDSNIFDLYLFPFSDFFGVDFPVLILTEFRNDFKAFDRRQ